MSKAVISRIIVYSLLLAAIFFAAGEFNRYRWSAFSSKYTRDVFTIYSNLPAEKLKHLAGTCVVFKSYFSDNIFPVGKKKTKIYLFDNSRDYLAYCGKINYFGSPHGFYSNELKLMAINLENGEGTLFHELVHFFIESGGYELPVWIEEGLSAFFEKYLGYYAGETDNFISFGYSSPWRFDEIREMRMRGRARLDVLYDEQSLAGCFVLYLYKKEKLVDFLKLYIKYRDVEKSLSGIFNRDAVLVESEWQDWIDRESLDPNVNFLEQSRIFDSRAELEDFIASKNAYWDTAEKIYKFKP